MVCSCMELNWVCVTHDHMVTRQQYSSYTSSSPSSSGCHGDSCLEYEPEGCPPAYTWLRVTDRQALLTHPHVDASCMVECDGHYWLLSTALNEAIQRDINQTTTDPANRSTSISGPAGQAHGGLFDTVPTLVANKPHPAIVNYINRLSSPKWPSHDQRQQIQQLPMNLVLVGHKESPRKDQAFSIPGALVKWFWYHHYHITSNKVTLPLNMLWNISSKWTVGKTKLKNGRLHVNPSMASF